MTTTTTAAPKGVKIPKPPALSFVTPEMATEWLESNLENRLIRQTQVDTLTRDIRAGAWQITGDPVKFDNRGILIDGQHRLWAIVNSGMTVPLFVIRDLPTHVRDVIDTGVKRTASDVLGFDGFKSTSRLVSMIRIAMAREDGFIANTDDRRRPPSYSNSEIAAYAEGHPELNTPMTRANTSYRSIGMKSTGLWAYCLATFDRIDPDLSLEFERSLVEMKGFGDGDPRATLLRWLQDARRTGVQSTIMVPRTMFAVFRTWNAWRNGQKLTKIQMGDHAPIPSAV